jgi:hypothetical protein
MLCSALSAQGFLNSLKKGIESATGIKTSDGTVFVYPVLGEWRMVLSGCRAQWDEAAGAGRATVEINIVRLLGGDVINMPCVWSAYSADGAAKVGYNSTSAIPLLDFRTGSAVKATFSLPGIPKGAKSLDVWFRIGNHNFEVRRVPVEWGQYVTVRGEDPSTHVVVGTETQIVQGPDQERDRYIPGKKGTQTVEISKTIPVNRLVDEEKYVLVDCSKYVETQKQTRSTVLEKVTVVDEKFVYAHKMDIEVFEKSYPYTSYFYLNDPKGEIINLSEAILDNEQREYSLSFTSTYAKKFPFYDAIRPMSEMMMAMGAMMGGTTTIAGQKEVLTPENAPAEIKTLATDFFNNTQNGYIIAVEGKLETADRDRRARGLLQQNYLRFFDDGLAAEFVGEDMSWSPVRFDDNYVVDFGEKKVPLTQASDESRALFDYIKANPETETTYSFAGDNTAKKYTFEYRFYDDGLGVFAMMYTPLTLRFDVRTFYDAYSDATYFIYFYSLGYDKKGVESTDRMSWDERRESIRKACGFDMDDYLLSPMDVLVEKMFATFQVVKIEIEEFMAYSLRVAEYITMHEVTTTETQTLRVDCSWLDKQTTSKWVNDYITVVEKVDKPTNTPGKWIKEIVPGQRWRIVRYITAPAKTARRVWLPAYVTFGRGEKEKIGPAAPKAAPKPAVVKKPDVEFDKAPVLSTSSVTYVALQDFAPTDIAEDVRFVYLIATAGYDDRTLLAIEKQTGVIKKVKAAPAGKSSYSPRKVMRDGSGRVLVEIASEGIFQCEGFNDPTPTKLELRTDNQWKDLINSELIGVMSNGGMLVYRSHKDLIVQDRESGAVKAQADKLAYSPSTDYKKKLAILPNGEIIYCFDQYSQGKIDRLTGLESGNATLTTGDVKTILGEKYRDILKIVVTPSGKVVALSDFGVHRSTDGGKTWKSVNKDSYDHTMVDMTVDSKENVHVIYQKGYGNYELRTYSPDLTKGLLSTKLLSTIPLIRRGNAMAGKFAGVGAAPRMFFADNAGNLWILGGGNEYTQGLLIFNPAGITGFPELTAKPSVVMKTYF